MIPYGRQDINQTDIDAVVEVLRSDFLTQGPMVPAFEKSIATYCGAQHAIAVNSATSALHIACLALGVGNGDVVWTTPITFVASANCALYCGASIDFVDIDPRTYNMSVDRLKEKLVQAEKKGNLPKVIIPVHFAGQSCDMASIHALSQQYDFKILEDASHAIGGRYKDEPIGSCRYSDITIFSFHPVKIITTGEGGMALTNNYSLAKKMRLLRSHGITRDLEEMKKQPDGPWYYEQVDLGFNYRMTDIQAALGVSQMLRLNDFISQRHAIAKRYNKLLADQPVVTPSQHIDSYSGMHLYVIRLNLEKIQASHHQAFESLRKQGIGVNLHYIPVYNQPYYKSMGFNIVDFPQAEKYYSEAISLPMYPTMNEEQQDKVIHALKKAILV
ncbi:MAG: UDP-4-amino-4,6-dideoxy-N-acetyl-beta-L-altrosamine transaminase [Gammaproteobacteria bacterium]|nr:UDP-4-amino-4,6-dideoxy-N-acetyl-beta-L-altrosamine transaminase [Gammaproteobacteria bacterium]